MAELLELAKRLRSMEMTAWDREISAALEKAHAGLEAERKLFETAMLGNKQWQVRAEAAERELAAERQRYAQDCSDMVAYVKSFGTLNEAIKALGSRAESAERRVEEAEMVLRGLVKHHEGGHRPYMIEVVYAARAFLATGKKEG